MAHLTDALVELGHDVTLFASADAREARFGPRPDLRLDPHPRKSDRAAHLSMLQELVSGKTTSTSSTSTSI